MTVVTVHFQTDQAEIDAGFFDHLNHLAQQYGVHVKSEIDVVDSAQIVREDREWLDQRDEERAAMSKGLQNDPISIGCGGKR